VDGAAVAVDGAEDWPIAAMATTAAIARTSILCYCFLLYFFLQRQKNFPKTQNTEKAGRGAELGVSVTSRADTLF
jgi:hypothetical protein